MTTYPSSWGILLAEGALMYDYLHFWLRYSISRGGIDVWLLILLSWGILLAEGALMYDYLHFWQRYSISRGGIDVWLITLLAEVFYSQRGHWCLTTYTSGRAILFAEGALMYDYLYFWKRYSISRGGIDIWLLTLLAEVFYLQRGHLDHSWISSPAKDPSWASFSAKRIYN